MTEGGRGRLKCTEKDLTLPGSVDARSSPLAGEDRGEGGSWGEVELNLIVEVTGEHKKDKVAKVSTANTLWLPAINNHGGFGKWAFIEITDPWNAKHEIRESLRDIAAGSK